MVSKVDDIVPITQGKLKAFAYEMYGNGRQDANKSIVARLKREQERTKLGFIQYERILELLIGYKEDVCEND